jgi:hypothetical protein
MALTVRASASRVAVARKVSRAVAVRPVASMNKAAAAVAVAGAVMAAAAPVSILGQQQPQLQERRRPDQPRGALPP